MNKLFVYGTLCPGQPNEHMLTQFVGEFLPASVRGHLHPEGWGQTMGYPGLILDAAGVQVPGYIYLSDEMAENWAILDEFEGDCYRRVKTFAMLESDETVEVYVYVLNR